MTDRVRLSGFDQMQNRVDVVGGIRGDENEHHCHGERKRNHNLNLSYAQLAESSHTHLTIDSPVVKILAN
jgi:hypothetical protein